MRFGLERGWRMTGDEVGRWAAMGWDEGGLGLGGDFTRVAP